MLGWHINVQEAVGWTISALVIAALAYRVFRSLRAALGRPGPNTAAVLAHSLAVGRSLLLLAVVLSISLGHWVAGRTGSSASGVGALGILALGISMVSETHWPRQSGAIRTAQLGASALRSLVRAPYVAGSVVAIASTTLAALFFLQVDSPVAAVPSRVTTTVFIDPNGSTVPTDCAGCTTSTQSFTNYATVSLNGVRLDCSLLVLTVLLGAFALWQIRRRRSLAGVDAGIDATLRQLSSERVVRIVMATLLGTVAAWASNLGAALQSPVPEPTSLALALSGFLVWVGLFSGLGILVLYLVGPTEKSVRRAAGLSASAPR